MNVAQMDRAAMLTANSTSFRCWIAFSTSRGSKGTLAA